ncbi:MAG: histidinol-phosphate transaminase [Clostridia bacterium]|nr:histidinol-phosphate transaminase [Clostridia bacterium]NCC76070.1 histidinol-phosphate transaminase [Clostridia bacterium]
MSDYDRDARRLWSRKVHGLTPYVPGEQPRDRVFIKLNTNENPYPPAPGVIEAIQTFPVERLKLYPDPTGLATRTALADYHGVALDQVFVGNGSDEVLAMAFQAFFNHHIDPATAKETEKIVFPDITYSFYPVYARLYDIPYRTVPLADDFTMPLASLQAPSAGIVLANPNAPTGIALALDDIRSLAAADRDRLILVDEAYVDFGGESAVALLPEFDNILVIQTLSKSRSLAGMRIGFAIGDPHLIHALERIRDSFNSYTLDSLAQTCAVAAFADGHWFETTRIRIMTTRERTTKALESLGFSVLPSAANFIFIRHDRYQAADLYTRLRDAGILVRHFKQPRIENSLRVSIGTDPDMDAFITALTEITADSQ